MAITFPGSVSQHVSPDSSAVSLLNGFHTTTVDTDLLLHFVAVEGAEAPDAAPSLFDIGGTDQAGTLLADTGDTGSNGDVRILVYGYLSPATVVNADVRFDGAFSLNPIASLWANVAGVDTASLAAATNIIHATADLVGASSLALNSGGSSGNALLAFFAGQGNDMNPSSVNNGFSELAEGVTDATASDLAYNLSALTSSLPSGVTITWSATNESSGVLIELVAAAGGGGSGSPWNYYGQL